MAETKCGVVYHGPTYPLEHGTVCEEPAGHDDHMKTAGYALALRWGMRKHMGRRLTTGSAGFRWFTDEQKLLWDQEHA